MWKCTASATIRRRSGKTASITCRFLLTEGFTFSWPTAATPATFLLTKTPWPRRIFPTLPSATSTSRRSSRSVRPRSPEPLDKTETGPHGVYVGEINPVSHKVDSLEFLPLCRSQYIPLAVSITPHTTNLELELKISQEIERRGRHHIYRFRIRGMRDPDVEFDLESLQSRYRISEVTDESEPQYDFSALFAQHPGDMIGFYIRALQKDDMSEVEKKALYYGIHALLQTTDERSPS